MNEAKVEFDVIRHYGEIVSDEESKDGERYVRVTWFKYNGHLYLTVRENGKLFFMKRY